MEADKGGALDLPQTPKISSFPFQPEQVLFTPRTTKNRMTERVSGEWLTLGRGESKTEVPQLLLRLPGWRKAKGLREAMDKTKAQLGGAST